jgi:succinate dehydrogenase/fumarate reductase flavoprotein subunit
MQKTMQDHAAVYRTQATLAEGVTKIDQVGRRIHTPQKADHRTQTFFQLYKASVMRVSGCVLACRCWARGRT